MDSEIDHAYYTIQLEAVNTNKLKYRDERIDVVWRIGCYGAHAGELWRPIASTNRAAAPATPTPETRSQIVRAGRPIYSSPCLQELDVN
jgi:hypothetical protein